MSVERKTCNQFSQHAWKRDICTNCSKHLSCHIVKEDLTTHFSKSTVNKETENNKSDNNDGTKPVVCSSKPSKPRKPSVSQGNVHKNVVDTKKTEVVKICNEEKAASNHASNESCSFDRSDSKTNFYEIYDIAAKGQSGKPLAIDDDNSLSDRDADSSTCLMATPYTVVDVISIALEKSRQSSQAGSIPPRLPSTPAPDFRRSQSSKKEHSLNTEKDETKKTEAILKEQISSEELEDFNSSNYRPRLYEEIDEEFLEKVASRKLEKKGVSEEDVSRPLPSDDSKNNSLKSAELGENKIQESNNKTKEKSKKSGGKSFFQKLLGKSNKDEDTCKTKMDKNGKKESSVDEKSLASSEEDARKSSESLLIDILANKDAGVVNGDAIENASDSLNQSSCIGEDFAKEIEEKFETLSRKSNFNKAGPMARSISNKVESSFDSSEKTKVALPGLGCIPPLNDGISTLPNRKSVLVQGMKKTDSSNNRKSMTPAEAKLARKMLVAPPPPPPFGTSSTSLASSSSHSASKDDLTSCPIRAPPSSFMSLQRKPDSNQSQLTTSQSPVEDVFDSSDIVIRNSIMDDLEEILKKGGMSQGVCSTLPKSFIQNQDKAARKSSMTTAGHIPSKESEISPSSVVQQRALPELPELPPPTARLQSSLSPESENLYEILPHSDDLPSPTNANLVSLKSEKPVAMSPVRQGGLTIAKDASVSSSLRSNSSQGLIRPRPAPRAAIRTVCINKPKEITDTLSKTAKEDFKTKTSLNDTQGLKLDASFEEKCSIIARTNLQSLQVFMEKFCSPSPLISLASNLFSKVDWKNKEAEIVKTIENKKSVLTWMKSVFYEIIISDVNCVLMLRRNSASPLSKQDHPNLMTTIHSFEAHLDLPECQRFFHSLSDGKNTNTGKSKYILDILPYSIISNFPSFLQLAANNSTNDSPYDISKYKVYTMLQLLDPLLHLQKSGKDLYRLYPSDILLVAPLQSASSFKKVFSSSSFLHPILVPTEYDEHSPRSDQKLLCRDLAKIASLIMTAPKTPSVTKHPEIIKGGKNTEVGQAGAQIPQPRARQTSVSLDKNDRCLRKVECLLTTGDSWHQVNTAASYIELSLWGPESEEEVRLALTSPQRGEVFDWWLGISRAEVLTSLMESTFSSTLSKVRDNSTTHRSNSEVVQNNDTKDLNKGATITSFDTALETMRKAEFLIRNDLESLLEAAKESSF